MEQSLKEQLLHFLSSMPVPMLLLDHLGNCTYANRSFEKLAGLTQGQAQGIGWLRHISGSRTAEIIARLLKGEMAETHFLLPDGEQRVTLKPTLDFQGRCCCVAETENSDIDPITPKSKHTDTETDENSKRQKETMQEILDNTDAILYSVDHQGNITHFNKSASRVIDFRRGAAVRIGDYWPHIVSGESGLDRERMVMLLDYVLSGRSYKIIEDVLVENNDKITYSVQASPIFDAARSVIGAVLCAHDITQLTRLQREAEEKAKQRTSELERWNQFYDMLLSVLAHDLRQPLSAIVMTADLVNHPSKEFSAQDIRTIMGDLRHTSTKSIELLQGLLHWVKSKKEDFCYRPTPLRLFDLVQDSNALFIHDQTAKNVRFCNEIHAEQILHAHEQMVLFVFRNLISNATKYARGDSEIFVRSTTSNGKIVVAIQDNGKGMTGDQLSRLFQIREHGTESAGVKGAGMALSIVHDMVQQMGGKIHAESKIGQGTIFFVTFPGSDWNDLA